MKELLARHQDDPSERNVDPNGHAKVAFRRASGAEVQIHVERVAVETVEQGRGRAIGHPRKLALAPIPFPVPDADVLRAVLQLHLDLVVVLKIAKPPVSSAIIRIVDCMFEM